MGPARQHQAIDTAPQQRAQLYRDLQARNARRARLAEARNQARLAHAARAARDQRRPAR